MFSKLITFFLNNRLLTFLLIGLFLFWGFISNPFGWKTGIFPKDPVAADAIPDIGENQQIVYTEWPGRSPQDIEAQVTYPLTAALLGIPGRAAPGADEGLDRDVSGSRVAGHRGGRSQ